MDGLLEDVDQGPQGPLAVETQGAQPAPGDEGRGAGQLGGIGERSGLHSLDQAVEAGKMLAVLLRAFPGQHQAAFERKGGEAVAETGGILPGAVVVEDLTGTQQIPAPRFLFSVRAQAETSPGRRGPDGFFKVQAIGSEHLLADRVASF